MAGEEANVATRPIVVGIDGSAAAWRAVEWAAAEAGRRQVPLRIVHAYQAVLPTDWAVAGATQEQWPAPIRRWLETADELVRLREPTVRPEVALVPGTPNEVLLAESRGARVLVVGSRGLQRPIEGLPESTTTFAAMHAHCPVVAVPAETPHPPVTGPVVLGVDGSAVSEAAIGVAFDAAAVRQTTLIAVHAWSDAVGESAGMNVGFELAQREQERLFADRLLPWRDKYPDVAVEPVVAHLPAVRALLRYAAGAGLLVVGTRGRGDFAGMLLGSTSQALLYCAPCPIAVVRASKGTQSTTGPGARDDFPSA